MALWTFLRRTAFGQKFLGGKKSSEEFFNKSPPDDASCFYTVSNQITNDSQLKRNISYPKPQAERTTIPANGVPYQSDDALPLPLQTNAASDQWRPTPPAMQQQTGPRFSGMQTNQPRFSGITSDRFSYLGMAGGDSQRPQSFTQRPQSFQPPISERRVSYWPNPDGTMPPVSQRFETVSQPAVGDGQDPNVTYQTFERPVSFWPDEEMRPPNGVQQTERVMVPVVKAPQRDDRRPNSYWPTD